ncbi:hypothetical protein HanIR_Chr13g0641331 [Helianthus annuus]|nr:hypothetical protein HanIR_Chr13g0641331 [Helianthus annuus]
MAYVTFTASQFAQHVNILTDVNRIWNLLDRFYHLGHVCDDTWLGFTPKILFLTQINPKLRR